MPRLSLYNATAPIRLMRKAGGIGLARQLPIRYHARSSHSQHSHGGPKWRPVSVLDEYVCNA